MLIKLCETLVKKYPVLALGSVVDDRAYFNFEYSLGEKYDFNFEYDIIYNKNDIQHILITREFTDRETGDNFVLYSKTGIMLGLKQSFLKLMEIVEQDMHNTKNFMDINTIKIPPSYFKKDNSLEQIKIILEDGFQSDILSKALQTFNYEKIYDINITFSKNNDIVFLKNKNQEIIFDLKSEKLNKHFEYLCNYSIGKIPSEEMKKINNMIEITMGEYRKKNTDLTKIFPELK